MIKSSREFEQIVYGDGNKLYLGKADIKLAGGMELPIKNSDTWDNGIQIVEQISNRGSFDIGFCRRKWAACNIIDYGTGLAASKYRDEKFMHGKKSN